MFFRDYAEIGSLLDTTGQLLKLIDRLSEPSAALFDCAEAAGTIGALLENEVPVPRSSLDMLAKLRSDFLSLQQSPRLTAAHASSLTYYLGLLRAEMNSEITVSYKFLFMPHKISVLRDMDTLLAAIAADPFSGAFVCPTPYALHDGEQVHVNLENIVCDLPGFHYAELDFAFVRPDVIVLGDYAPEHREHPLAMFAPQALVEQCVLLLSVPSLRGLSKPLQQSFKSLGDGVGAAAASSLLANVKQTLRGVL